MSERREDEGNPLGWGKADVDARDDATQENVEEGQVRNPEQPREYDVEHRGEERTRGE